MKKALIAAALVVASGSAMADVDGGRIDFNGLVQTGTCAVGVQDAGKQSVTTDGTVNLDTVKAADVLANAGVEQNTVGLMPKEFDIQVDCSASTFLKTHLTMGSASFANSNGTLNNNTNITVNGLAAAAGVNVAVHDITNGTPALVNMNNGSDVHTLDLDTDGKATYKFNASYVKAANASAVTAGHVTTNALYTITYD
ncbi:fimbrial protein [Salmonella enterica subsp. enterica serovar Kotte]|nr:fimbrial protein [Salmonella enterica subsp. enterica serovar Kotte]